jgi:hypothetical protein
MVVIRHQHVGTQLPAEVVDRFLQQVKKVKPIAIIGVDRSLLDATIGDMPDGTRELES